MADINDWDIIDANNSAAPPDGWPENMDYDQVNNTGRAMMGVMARFYADNNGSVQAAGTNSYAVTLNTSHAAYFNGMHFTCQIPNANTGAVTMNVNSLGAIPVVAIDGSALVAGDIPANSLLELHYISAEFHVVRATKIANVNNTASGEVVLAYAGTPRFMTRAAGAVYVLSDGNTDTEEKRVIFSYQNLTQRGFVGYTNTDVLQLRNQINGGDIFLTANSAGGTPRNILIGNPDTNTLLYNSGEPVLQTGDSSVGIHGTVNDDPFLSFFSSDNLTRRGFLQTAAAGMKMKSEVNGVAVFLEATDAGGVARSILIGDPDTTTTVYAAGVSVLNVATGQINVRSAGNGDSESRRLVFEHQNGTDRGYVGHFASSTLRLNNLIHGAETRIAGEDSGGNTRDGFIMDPDGIVTIRHPATNNDVLRTTTPGAGGLQIQNTLTGTGWERPLTESDKFTLTKFLSANFSSFNTTTLANVTELSSLQLAAGQYKFKAVFAVTVGANGVNVKLRFIAPGTAALSSADSGLSKSAQANGTNSQIEALLNLAADTYTYTIAITPSGGTVIEVTGTVEVTVAGTVNVQMAQQNASVSSTSMLAGSFIEYTKLN